MGTDMKRQHALGFGMGLVVGAILSVALPSHPLASLPSPASLAIPEAVHRAFAEEAPVLVIDVREPCRAAAVRAAVSSDRATTWSVPAGLAVAATSRINPSGATPARSASRRQTCSGGSWPDSSRPTATAGRSRPPMVSKSGSPPMAARSGPLAMAK